VSLNRDTDSIVGYILARILRLFLCAADRLVWMYWTCFLCGERFVKATAQKSFSSLASCLGEGSSLNLFFFFSLFFSATVSHMRIPLLCWQKLKPWRGKSWKHTCIAGWYKNDGRHIISPSHSPSLHRMRQGTGGRCAQVCRALLILSFMKILM